MKGISNLGSLRRLENINARSGSSQPYTQPPKKCDGGKEKKKLFGNWRRRSFYALFACLGAVPSATSPRELTSSPTDRWGT